MALTLSLIHILAVAVYNHYKRIRHGEIKGDEVELSKSCLLYTSRCV